MSRSPNITKILRCAVRKSTCMAEVCTITVHSHYFQVNYVDRAKQGKQWVDVHISQCLAERCALVRHDWNDVSLLEWQRICVSFLNEVKCRVYAHSHKYTIEAGGR